MHNTTKSGAGNVPFFHPGSELAVRHAWISGCWSHPTGQAACEREPAGRGQRREGGREGWRRREGEAVLGFAECKMSQNGPRVWFLIRKTPEISSHQSPDLDCAGSFKCCIKRVASNMMKKLSMPFQNLQGIEACFKRKKEKNGLPAKFTDSNPHPVITLFCCFLPGPIIKTTLLWPHSDVPLPPAGRTVNGIL